MSGPDSEEIQDKAIADIEKRLEVIERNFPKSSKCPAGQHWDSSLNKCVDNLPPPPHDYPRIEVTWATSSGVHGSNVPHNVFDADENLLILPSVHSFTNLVWSVYYYIYAAFRIGRGFADSVHRYGYRHIRVHYDKLYSMT